MVLSTTRRARRSSRLADRGSGGATFYWISRNKVALYSKVHSALENVREVREKGSDRTRRAGVPMSFDRSSQNGDERHVARHTIDHPRLRPYSKVAFFSGGK